MWPIPPSMPPIGGAIGSIGGGATGGGAIGGGATGGGGAAGGAGAPRGAAGGGGGGRKGLPTHAALPGLAAHDGSNGLVGSAFGAAGDGAA
jgi:hypothetical protein